MKSVRRELETHLALPEGELDDKTSKAIVSELVETILLKDDKPAKAPTPAKPAKQKQQDAEPEEEEERPKKKSKPAEKPKKAKEAPKQKASKRQVRATAGRMRSVW